MFLGFAFAFAFAGFPLMHYFNARKKVKYFYGEDNSVFDFVTYLTLCGGKFFFLGLINGYIENYDWQCLLLLMMYTVEVVQLKRIMKRK